MDYYDILNKNLYLNRVYDYYTEELIFVGSWEQCFDFCIDNKMTIMQMSDYDIQNYIVAKGGKR